VLTHQGASTREARIANAAEETNDDVRSVEKIDSIVCGYCKKGLRCSRFFISRIMHAMCE
jgi:hypothetical protein